MQNTAVQTTQSQKPAPVGGKRDIRSLLSSDAVKSQVALVLPKYLTPDRMLRVALTACNRNPKLLNCTPQSLLGSIMKLSQAGLEPDGRKAHLIPYGDQCEAIIDWKGYVDLLRRNGVEMTAKLVCRNDKFIVEEDNGEGRSVVHHTIDYTADRGDVYAVYSRAKIGDTVDYEIMTKAEVEYVRQTFSRGKDADAWRKSWGEMARKTVIRRHQKRLPLDSDMAAALDVEDDQPTAQVTTQAPVIPGPRLMAPVDNIMDMPEEVTDVVSKTDTDPVSDKPATQAPPKPQDKPASVRGAETPPDAQTTQGGLSPEAAEAIADKVAKEIQADEAAEATAGLAHDPAAEHAEQSSQENAAEFVVNKAESDELNDLRYLMFKHNVSEEQLMKWSRSKKLAREDQKALGDLATNKHAQIAKRLASLVAEIKAA